MECIDTADVAPSVALMYWDGEWLADIHEPQIVGLLSALKELVIVISN